MDEDLLVGDIYVWDLAEGENLEKQHAVAPDIGFESELVELERLNSHPFNGKTSPLGHIERIVRLPTQTKIGDLKTEKLSRQLLQRVTLSEECCERKCRDGCSQCWKGRRDHRRLARRRRPVEEDACPVDHHQPEMGMKKQKPHSARLLDTVPRSSSNIAEGPR